MEPEKFENKVKKLLQEREINPSADSWERLEQRMEQKKGSSRSNFWWVGAAAAVAVVIFLVGSYFSAPVASETPQIVEETPEKLILEEKTTEPEVLQVVTSEVEEIKEKTSAETPSKNAIFETSVPEVSEEEVAVVMETSSEATEVVVEDASAKEFLLNETKAEIAAQEFSSEVSDNEIEALLLLATAELKADTVYTVNADDLLHQVEYELDQSFRQKVFEVVKEGLLKAKTAVANRDF